MLQVYEIFVRLSVSAQPSSQPYGCSIANELLMILRKQANMISSFDLTDIYINVNFIFLIMLVLHIFILFMGFLLVFLLMLQINNSDLMYKKMGLIGVLKIVSYIADTNNASLPPLSHVMCLS